MAEANRLVQSTYTYIYVVARSTTKGDRWLKLIGLFRVHIHTYT